jgi:hypothetical protein
MVIETVVVVTHPLILPEILNFLGALGVTLVIFGFMMGFAR